MVVVAERGMPAPEDEVGLVGRDRRDGGEPEAEDERRGERGVEPARRLPGPARPHQPRLSLAPSPAGRACPLRRFFTACARTSSVSIESSQPRQPSVTLWPKTSALPETSSWRPSTRFDSTIAPTMP